MFQLKHRLERVKISQPPDSLATNLISHSDPLRLQDELGAHSSDLLPDSAELFDDRVNVDGTGILDEEVLLDPEGTCEGKPETGNRRVRARFGRRRTHNEQLCVASCGVILGRATFFGSEAPNGVRVSPLSSLDYACIVSLLQLKGIFNEAFPYESFASRYPLARQQLPSHCHAPK
jgi:hypothetical protein